MQLPNFAPTIRVVQMLVHETGTYNQQYRRPYQANITAANANALAETMMSAQQYTPGLLAGLANDALKPQAAPEGEIAIAGGWGERRMRFMLEVEHSGQTGVKTRATIMGYTNYRGVSLQGSIDPNMEFFVNSVVATRESVETTPMGVQTYRNVVDSSHVLQNDHWDSAGIYGASHIHRMRPEDIYSTMSVAYLDTDVSTADLRTLQTSQAVKSRRSNALAPNYMATILENYRTASIARAGQMDPRSEQSSLAIIQDARAYARESPMARDQFLNAVANVRNTPVGNVFTFADLCKIDPNADNLTAVVLMQPTQRAQVHSTGDTSHWNGTDQVTQVATVLSQSVPSLMMDLALVRLVFTSTNHLIGGQITTTVVDSNSFSSVNEVNFIAAFVERLRHEILMDLTFGNQIPFYIQMQVDLMGETWVKLSINGHPEVDFVTPSFCDALTVPVLTMNANTPTLLANDLSSLYDRVHDGKDLYSRPNISAGFTPQGGFGRI